MRYCRGGRGPGLYFHVLLRLTSPSSSPGAQDICRKQGPQSALFPGYCTWAVIIVQSTKLPARGVFPLPRASHTGNSVPLCPNTHILSPFGREPWFADSTWPSAAGTSPGTALCDPQEDSPPPSHGAGIRCLLQAGNLSLWGCHTETEKQMRCFFL